MSDLQMPPVLDGLSPLEEAVIDAARRGVWAEPDPDAEFERLTDDARDPVEHLAVTDDPKLQVRAQVIRELLMGRRGELDPRGVLIRRVRVVGKLDLDHITAVTGLALTACALPEGITCTNARLRQVSLDANLITGLDADGLRIDGNLSLRDATITSGTDDEEGAALRLRGAHISGHAHLDRITVKNITGPAVDADGLHVGADLYLQDADVIGVSKGGALLLTGAHIGGRAHLERVTLTNVIGPALIADGLRTDGLVSLFGATVDGTGEIGGLRLLGAHIGEQLILIGARVSNTKGPGLIADGLRVDGNLSLADATVIGTGEGGALRLAGTQLNGQVDLAVAQLICVSGPMLVMAEARVSAALFLPADVVCPRARHAIGKQSCPDSKNQLILQGLTFSELGYISWLEWSHLLVHHTPSYRPQPYQQLAAVERAAGHDNNARRILITQQDDLRRRAPEALGGLIARWRHWLWGWLGRYGYRAHRLVTSLLIVLLLAGVTGYTAGQTVTRPGHHAAERVPTSTTPATTPATAPGTPCSTAELIGLGIDRGLPLGATGLRARCDLDTATRRGQTFTYLLWALQALLWALATLAVAAYTGLVRKPT